jgi:hypothetical protein
MTIERILKEVDQFTPTSGFNVVGVDDFELPGECLFLVGHFDEEDEANAVRDAKREASPGTKFYVYGPRGELTDGEMAEMAEMAAKDRIAMGLPPKK